MKPEEPLITHFAYQETNKEFPYDSMEQGEKLPDTSLTQEIKLTEIGKFDERQNVKSGIKANLSAYSLSAHMGDILLRHSNRRRIKIRALSRPFKHLYSFAMVSRGDDMDKSACFYEMIE